jgi:uncharacterized damage-inducible protein DinB
LTSKKTRTASLFLESARERLAELSLPLIVKSLNQLTDEEIWWRPNAASNSAGNLVLHLCGNVRQWIIAGLGGEKFNRQRDLEFSEQGPIPRKELVARLRNTVRDACKVLAKLSDEELARKYSIQGYHVTGLDAVFHVTEHFGYHTGQIIYITKLKRAEDLRFTRLPKIEPGKN